MPGKRAHQQAGGFLLFPGAGEQAGNAGFRFDEYAALRRNFLPADGALQEEENIAYLEMMAFFYAGEDFLVAAHKNGKNLYCPELLGNTDAAPGIVTALGCTAGSFRSPGDSCPGVMLHVLIKDVTAPGYFGLTFE